MTVLIATAVIAVAIVGVVALFIVRRSHIAGVGVLEVVSWEPVGGARVITVMT